MMRRIILQAGVIPVRHGPSGIEVCLITSTSGRRWGFPKGIIEPGQTPQEAALTEAFEEAGLHGEITDPPIGRYRYQKWGSELEVTLYLMEVAKADDDWAESDIRQREWLPADEAFSRLDRDPLRQLLGRACEPLS